MQLISPHHAAPSRPTDSSFALALIHTDVALMRRQGWRASADANDGLGAGNVGSANPSQGPIPEPKAQRPKLAATLAYGIIDAAGDKRASEGARAWKMPEVSSGRERIAYRAFQDTDAYLDDLYSVYTELYASAPRIQHEVTLQDRYSFEYCLARRYFVLMLPYTKHKEFLLERSFASNQLAWVLVGGSLRRDLTETFIDAANRHASKTIRNLQLGEVEPIAFLENRFRYEGREHFHRGIAFVGRIRNMDPQQDLKAAVHSRGHLVPCEDTSVPVGLLHNKTVVELARSYVRSLDLDSVPEFEVEENIKYGSRYAFHDAVVKPLFRSLGRFHFQHSIQDLEAKILEITQACKHDTILDVACGENTAVLRFTQLPGVRLVVGNDVSWSQIKLMSERFSSPTFRNISSFILFTNHDARRLPFGDNHFDFVLCKNVLHHMENVRAVKTLINEVIRVGKISCIIEIMDPQFESTWGRVRHRYYLKFLRDAGRHFLSRNEFAALTGTTEKANLFEMNTIRGIYQFAVFRNAAYQEPPNPNQPQS
ncbi:MAG: class I SAM-dependent methyltransferase [Candidatus Aenigmarchaeota archaeon]|nr:class I SAM-dependent methyltransferase [Candidatus Aenigmarchaeota archaeon]